MDDYAKELLDKWVFVDLIPIFEHHHPKVIVEKQEDGCQITPPKYFPYVPNTSVSCLSDRLPSFHTLKPHHNVKEQPLLPIPSSSVQNRVVKNHFQFLPIYDDTIDLTVNNPKDFRRLSSDSSNPKAKCFQRGPTKSQTVVNKRKVKEEVEFKTKRKYFRRKNHLQKASSNQFMIDNIDIEATNNENVKPAVGNPQSLLKSSCSPMPRLLKVNNSETTKSVDQKKKYKIVVVNGPKGIGIPHATLNGPSQNVFLPLSMPEDKDKSAKTIHRRKSDPQPRLKNIFNASLQNVRQAYEIKTKTVEATVTSSQTDVLPIYNNDVFLCQSSNSINIKERSTSLDNEYNAFNTQNCSDFKYVDSSIENIKMLAEVACHHLKSDSDSPNHLLNKGEQEQKESYKLAVLNNIRTSSNPNQKISDQKIIKNEIDYIKEEKPTPLIDYQLEVEVKSETKEDKEETVVYVSDGENSNQTNEEYSLVVKEIIEDDNEKSNKLSVSYLATPKEENNYLTTNADNRSQETIQIDNILDDIDKLEKYQNLSEDSLDIVIADLRKVLYEEEIKAVEAAEVISDLKNMSQESIAEQSSDNEITKDIFEVIISTESYEEKMDVSDTFVNREDIDQITENVIKQYPNKYKPDVVPGNIEADNGKELFNDKNENPAIELKKVSSNEINVPTTTVEIEYIDQVIDNVIKQYPNEYKPDVVPGNVEADNGKEVFNDKNENTAVELKKVSYNEINVPTTSVEIEYIDRVIDNVIKQYADTYNTVLGNIKTNNIDESFSQVSKDIIKPDTFDKMIENQNTSLELKDVELGMDIVEKEKHSKDKTESIKTVDLSKKTNSGKIFKNVRQKSKKNKKVCVNVNLKKVSGKYLIQLTRLLSKIGNTAMLTVLDSFVKDIQKNSKIKLKKNANTKEISIGPNNISSLTNSTSQTSELYMEDKETFTTFDDTENLVLMQTKIIQEQASLLDHQKSILEKYKIIFNERKNRSDAKQRNMEDVTPNPNSHFTVDKTSIVDLQTQTAVEKSIVDLQTQTAVEKRIVDLQTHTAFEKSIVDLQTQTAVEKRIVDLQTHTAFEKSIVDSQTQTAVEKSILDSQTQTAVEKCIVDLQAQTAVEKSIVDSQTQTAVEKSIVDLQTQTSVEKSILDSQTQTAVEKCIVDLQAQTAVEKSIVDSQTQTAVEKSIVDSQTQTAVEKCIVDLQAQTAVEKSIVDSQTQTAVEKSIVDSQTQTAVEKSTVDLQAQTAVEKSIVDSQTQTAVEKSTVDLQAQTAVEKSIVDSQTQTAVEKSIVDSQTQTAVEKSIVDSQTQTAVEKSSIVDSQTQTAGEQSEIKEEIKEEICVSLLNKVHDHQIKEDIKQEMICLSLVKNVPNRKNSNAQKKKVSNRKNVKSQKGQSNRKIKKIQKNKRDNGRTNILEKVKNNSKNANSQKKRKYNRKNSKSQMKKENKSTTEDQKNIPEIEIESVEAAASQNQIPIRYSTRKRKQQDTSLYRQLRNKQVRIH